MYGTSFAIINTEWALPSDDVNKNEDAIPSYSGVVNYLSRHYATFVVVVSAND